MRYEYYMAIALADEAGRRKDPRMMTRDDWDRTVEGDNAVQLTRDINVAKKWRSRDRMDDAYLAFSEMKLARRGFTLIRVKCVRHQEAEA